MAGQSYTMNWDVDVINGGSASFSERTPNKKNRIPDGRPLTIVSSVLEIIDQAFKMGILSLKPGNLTWTASDAFVAEAEIGGRMNGKVTEWDGSRPRTLAYAVESLPGRRFVVRYSYRANDVRPADVPYQIVCEGFLHEKSVMLITNLIEELQFGEASVGTSGYDYTLFTNLADIYPILYENGRIYALQNGTKTLVYSGGAFQVPRTPKSRFVKFGFIVFNLAVVVALIVFFMKKTKKPSNHQPHL